MFKQVLPFIIPTPLTERFGFQTRVFTSWISLGLIIGLICGIVTLSSGTAAPNGAAALLLEYLIIPVHLWKDSQLVVMAERYRVIDMNGRENRMLLPDEFHRPNHDKDSPYSQTVRRYLRDRWNALVEADLDDDPDEIRGQLLLLIGELRANLEELVAKGGYMNDI